MRGKKGLKWLEALTERYADEQFDNEAMITAAATLASPSPTEVTSSDSLQKANILNYDHDRQFTWSLTYPTRLGSSFTKFLILWRLNCVPVHFVYPKACRISSAGSQVRMTHPLMLMLSKMDKSLSFWTGFWVYKVHCHGTPNDANWISLESWVPLCIQPNITVREGGVTKGISASK